MQSTLTSRETDPHEIFAIEPDVVLAEPVGSCLDMVGTVIRPLEQSYGRRFEVAPYGVR